METSAKAIIQCDSCKTTLQKPKSKDEVDLSLKATLSKGANGETKDYHFCDETCLRNFLNARYKASKASESHVFGHNGVYTLELPTCFKKKTV